MNISDINCKNTRSYKTVANLEAALERFGFDKFRYVVVHNSEGRATAIFTGKQLEDYDGDMCKFAREGFLTI
jgi:histidinol phosphatase-like enzyme